MRARVRIEFGARGWAVLGYERTSAMKRPRSVLVVDGDPEFRGALSRALRRAGYPTQQARTGEEALEAAGRQRPALVIMETHLTGASGYEICREFRERYGEDLPIIFVSAARTDETDRVAGLLLGADDYLAKPIRLDHLLARARRLVAQSAAVAGPVVSRLTPREQEVLELLADGLEQDEIANRLFITPKTVAKHVEHILGKLGVRSRAQAIVLALRGDSPDAQGASTQAPGARRSASAQEPSGRRGRRHG
jgi:DNA-binding NarL/FixJ family response regulator